jgi:hypothetical protein
MKLGDLDSIYQDKDLRPLITIQPKGHKFAAVIEEEGLILGGASGYAEDRAAFLQCAVIKEVEQRSLYKDGLIRSLIHFLELDGTDFLFVREDDPLYREIGFHKIQPDSEFTDQLSETIEEDIQQGNILCINLKEFFISHKH